LRCNDCDAVHICGLEIRHVGLDTLCADADAVMLWASEHPEPVYPTWIEWLKKFGIISFEPDFHSLLSAYPTRTNSVKVYINEEGGKPIPADIAQKLGLQPK
jgi:hypothetical protein